MYEIYINTVKASKEDMQTLKEFISKGKDHIKQITIFNKKICIYTV